LTQSGERLTAVVAGNVAIDPSLIAQRDGSLVHLCNGSVCFIADDDGAALLAALAEGNNRPDHVVFEGAAARDLRRLSGYGYMPGYHLDGIVIVVDAPTVWRYAKEGTGTSNFAEQVGVADVILLNKLDLLEPDQADAAHCFLDAIAPASRVLSCNHARVAPALVLGASSRPDARAIVTEWTNDFVFGRARGRTPAYDAEQCRTWRLVREEPVDGREFRTWVRRLPTTILSGRGQVYLSEERQHRHVFHLMGSRWYLERGALWRDDVPSTQLRLAGTVGRRRVIRSPALHASADPPFAGGVI
jgi:G3E family GTPase